MICIVNGIEKDALLLKDYEMYTNNDLRNNMLVSESYQKLNNQTRQSVSDNVARETLKDIFC